MTSSASDPAGTLKVKVYLKQADKYYTATGELVESKESAGKEVTLSGFKNTSAEQEQAAKTWYDALPSTFAADSESAKKLASEFKTDTQIQALITAMTNAEEKAKFTAPTSPAGFTVSYSFVSVDETTLKFKALLKNGETIFNSADGKITTDSNLGKEVTVTGFTSENAYALAKYKALT
ncbi:hypothetical protein CJJ23_04820, partial [Mycoplasmopsis agassizii]